MIRERDSAGDEAGANAAIPTGVRDVIQQRIARLPARTVSLLEVGAVLGRQAPVPLLARVADRPLEECLDDLEPALLTRLVVTPPDEPGAIRFTHALVRETLAEAMSSLRRARLHLRAADGITAVSGSTDDIAEIVAEHLWQAAALGVSDRAAAALEAAAQVALRREALVSAESLLRRAAGLYRAAGTEDGLAELRVLRQIGFVGAALHGYAVNADSELIRRARELARVTDRRDILLDMIWADWAGCDTGGQPHRAVRLVQEAEVLVAGSDDPLLLAGVSSMRGFSERHFGRMDRSRVFIERAVDLFTAAGPAQEAGFYLNGFLTSMGYRHWARTLTEGLDRAALEQDYLAQDRPFGRMVLSLFGSAAAMAVGDQPGLRLFARRMMAADPQMRALVLVLRRGALHRGEHAAGRRDRRRPRLVRPRPGTHEGWRRTDDAGRPLCRRGPGPVRRGTRTGRPWLSRSGVPRTRRDHGAGLSAPGRHCRGARRDAGRRHRCGGTSARCSGGVGH